VQALGGAKNFVVVMPDADIARRRDLDRVVLRLRGRAVSRETAWCSRSVTRTQDQCDKLVEQAKKLRVGDGADRA
jgi:acyl-CoA reductase-like NAD-dependent aldehyde dehydrogenase